MTSPSKPSGMFGNGTSYQFEGMPRTNEAMAFVRAGGFQKITVVPANLYESVKREFPERYRFSINDGTENMIVWGGNHAITPMVGEK